MRWDDFLTENPTFFLFICFRIIVILISIEDRKTKMIDFPSLGNRLMTSDLCFRGKLSHLSPLFPTHQFYVLHKKLSKMNDNLKRKIEQSIKLLQAYDKFCKDRFTIELAYSGGKDSDVILQLAKEAAIDFQPIYKMTTIDPPGTIKHVRDMGVEVRRPKYNFFQLIEKKGLPSRRMRFCCENLKEYKIHDKVIVGVRASESRKRKELYKEPSNCRIGKKEHVEQILPILYWTDEDIKEFIEDRNIKCAPIYYNDNGIFDVKRRLGCMGCPLLSYKKRLEEFRLYPNIANRYIKACKVYLDNHQSSKVYVYNKGDPYRFFLRDFFPYTNKIWDEIVTGLFGPPNFEEVFKRLFIR